KRIDAADAHQLAFIQIEHAVAVQVVYLERHIEVVLSVLIGHGEQFAFVELEIEVGVEEDCRSGNGPIKEAAVIGQIEPDRSRKTEDIDRELDPAGFRDPAINTRKSNSKYLQIAVSVAREVVTSRVAREADFERAGESVAAG